MNRKKAQKGSALVYILIAIALLAALTATFMGSSDQQGSSSRGFDIVSELNSQITFIRSAIQQCVLTYPKGDTSMAAAPALVGGQAVNRPYPLNPNNTYLLNPTVALSAVRDIRCPGNPGNSNNHTKIFGGSSGKFFPPTTKLFEGWYYYNDIDGVFIFTMSAATDAFVDTALQRLDSNYSKCEAQYVNATAAQVHMTSNNNASFACPVGYRCFLVHLVTTPSTIYPGEVGCP